MNPATTARADRQLAPPRAEPSSGPAQPSGPLADTARAWLAAGTAAIDVAIVAHRGSVPRETGTHMLVAAQTRAGSIGGGHLEWKALEAARALLAAGAAGPVELAFPLGPALGQCCGGHVTLRLQRLSPESLAAWASPAERFFLQLHGAGHVGRAVAHLLATLPCRVQWIDERDDAFPPPGEGPDAAHLERLAVDSPEAEVALAPPQACFLVLTHSHDLDLRIVEAILRRDDLRWCGLIGSATKRARFEHRLRSRGLTPAQLARLTCPAGLPGIVGKEPEVIAVGVVAQLLGLGDGRPDRPGNRT
ncbi:MAG: xanthine dehydrogenase accessory protein XdhC [Burkholderiaceae bacterium]|nr:xanthine dehydrogenase accessory protein XdhC [Burkholderiaceae bacterium]